MLKSVEGNVHFRVGRIVKFLQGFAQRALVTPVGRLTDQSLTRQWLPPSGDYSLMKSIIGRRSYHTMILNAIRPVFLCAAILDREVIPQAALTKKFADDRDGRAPCR